MNSPNFFIVGAMKAGTTSLYHYLSQHPEIYMSPIKEPNYFSRDLTEDLDNYNNINLRKYFSINKLKKIHFACVTQFDDYIKLFKDVRYEKAIGEASTSYLYSKVAAKEINKFIPSAKIIMILRNPIDRAYSHYLMDVQQGIITNKNFIEDIKDNFNKIDECPYIKIGCYYRQVKQYITTFPNSQIKIILYDDYKRYPLKIIQEIFEFLCVSKDFVPNIRQNYNIGAIPKYPKISKFIVETNNKFKTIIPYKIKPFLNRLYHRFFLKEKRTLSASERKFLLRYFKEDIEKLATLIDRDLSIWLEP